jgi:Uma2 family endonuclease
VSIFGVGKELRVAQAKKIETFVTPEEYLEGELTTEIRNEFINGVVYAMSGVSEAHNDIVLNLVRLLAGALPVGCRMFSQSVKLRADTKSHEDYYYPDVFISCGPRDLKGHVRRDAILVIEVLSPTTERVDRGEKFHAYTSLPSVEEYILVSQDKRSIEVYRRNANWKRELYGAADTIPLTSLKNNLTVDEIYRDIPL